MRRAQSWRVKHAHYFRRNQGHSQTRHQLCAIVCASQWAKRSGALQRKQLWLGKAAGPWQERSIWAWRWGEWRRDGTEFHGVGRRRIGGYVAPKRRLLRPRLHFCAHFISKRTLLGETPVCFWRTASSGIYFWFVRKLETDERVQNQPPLILLI